jgi:hypothetical protein
MTIGTSTMTGQTSASHDSAAAGHLRQAGPATAEARVALPTKLLLGLIALAGLLVAGGWSAAVAVGPWTMREFNAGMAGIAVTALVAFAGVFIITPWKRRLIADWMNMWLLATVFRMLGTPTAAYVLYSAVSPALAAKPFGLAVALTYIATLFVEAAALAKHLKTAIDQPSPIGNGHVS